MLARRHPEPRRTSATVSKPVYGILSTAYGIVGNRPREDAGKTAFGWIEEWITAV